MAKEIPHLEKIKILSNAYGAGLLADMLGVTERAMQIWHSEPDRKPRKETLRTLGELFARHTAGENIATSGNKNDYKEKYINSLESQVKLLTDQVSSATGELRHIAVMNYAILKTLRKSLAQLIAKSERQDLLKVAERLDKETNEFYRSIRNKGSLIEEGI